MICAATYARYSSALQRPTSIEDQLALCRQYAARIQAEVDEAHVFTDVEISGAVAQRPGYQRLLEAARRGEFEAIIVEAQDRLWRSQAEMHRALEELSFLGVRVFSAEIGSDLTEESGHLVASVKGLMDEAFLRSLREKTRRGMLGQVRRGLSPGGRAYGYRSVPTEHGYRRVIDPAEAAVVREIYTLYASGFSPKSIAKTLNHRGVPAPRGRRGWTWTTISGNPKKLTGILVNPIYIGRVIWNRSRKLRDPLTGSRRTRPRDPSEWVMVEQPDLRIVSDELWAQVQTRKKQLGEAVKARGLGHPVSPRSMLSGILVCAECGAPYVKKTRVYYGCSNYANRGRAICANGRLVRRDVAEGMLLKLVRDVLLDDDGIRDLVQIVNEALAKEAPAAAGALVGARRELENIKTAIRRGVVTESTLQMLQDAELQVRRLESRGVRPAPVTEREIREQVRSLSDALDGDAEGARRVLQTVLGTVEIRPTDDGADAVLRGNLEGVLSLVAGGSVQLESHGAGRGI